MAITKKNTAEGGTNGTAVTTGNSGGSSGDAFNLISVAGTVTFATAAATHGSLGLSFAPTSGAQSLVRYTGFNNTTGVVRWYHTFSVAPAANETIGQAKTSADVNVISVGVRSDSKYIVQNAAGTTLTGFPSTAVAAAGDRIEMSWTVGTTTSNGSWNWYLYRADATTATETKSGTTDNLGTTNWDYFQIGKCGTSTWVPTIKADDLAVASGTTTLFGVPTVAVAPTASFTSVVNGQTASFTDTSTYTSPATAISSWAWNFGDSTTSTAQNPVHRYASPGTYTVSLIVTDNQGTSSTSTSVSTVAVAGTTAAYLGAVTQSTNWTPTSSTALAVLSDTDQTSFIASSANPSSLALEGYFLPLVSPASGQPFIVTLFVDRVTSTSGTFNAQLYDFDGTTLRSSLTSVAIQDMTASGGSGTITSGTVAGTLQLIFPWTDVQNVTASGWDKLTIKLQATSS